MREIWLKTNRRALFFGMVPLALIVGLGVALIFRARAFEIVWLQWLGVAMWIGGGLLMGILATQLTRPRVAYDDGQVLFYLRTGLPLAVPVEHVEAFFIGQGPVMIPGAPQHDVSVNLVARLSQREPSYAQREVKPALGAWSDGYVVIRGTWCERIGTDLVRRLNRRLREVTEARSSNAGASLSAPSEG
jgi:hypothetical protein